MFESHERINFRIAQFDVVVVLTAHPVDVVRYLISQIVRKLETKNSLVTNVKSLQNSLVAFLSQHGSVIETLHEASASYSLKMKSRAAGLLGKLCNGNIALISLLISCDIVAPLENLNPSLQKHSQTISNTISAVNLICKSNETHLAQRYA